VIGQSVWSMIGGRTVCPSEYLVKVFGQGLVDVLFVQVSGWSKCLDNDWWTYCLTMSFLFEVFQRKVDILLDQQHLPLPTGKLCGHTFRPLESSHWSLRLVVNSFDCTIVQCSL